MVRNNSIIKKNISRQKLQNSNNLRKITIILVITVFVLAVGVYYFFSSCKLKESNLVSDYLNVISSNKVMEIKPNNGGGVSALCPDSLHILNGGCRMQGMLSKISLLESHYDFSNPTRGWTCYGWNNDEDNKASIEVYISCS